MLQKLKRYLSDPYYALGYDLMKICPNVMSDRFYIRTLWRMAMGYDLDLKNPKTFNEKLQWLKLHDHNPLYTTLVDKLRVKDWVSEKIGAQYVIPTLATYNSVDEIDIDKLPNQFVLKCNHDSGSVVVCKDKSTFDLAKVKETLKQAIKKNYYWNAREWVYKNIKPCVFAEAYLEDSTSRELRDYKFFAFDGKVKVLYVATERGSVDVETKFDFFDINFNHIDVTNGHPNSIVKIHKPLCFNEMIKFSEILSKDFPHVRVDFYEVDGHVFFGELTFFHMGGFEPFYPTSFDEYLGSFIQLP